MLQQIKKVFSSEIARKSQVNSVQIETTLVQEFTVSGNSDHASDILFLSSEKIHNITNWPEHMTKDPRLFVAIGGKIVIINLKSKEIENAVDLGQGNARVNCIRLISGQYLISTFLVLTGVRFALYRPHDLKILAQTDVYQQRTTWRLEVVGHDFCVAGLNGWYHPTKGTVLTMNLSRDYYGKVNIKANQLPVDHQGHIWCLRNLRTLPHILVTCGGGATIRCNDFTVRKWNLRTRELERRFSDKAHSAGVISVDSFLSPNGAEYVISCSRDGNVVTYDLLGNVILTIRNFSKGDLEGVYTLLCYQDRRFFCGGMEGSIFFFDYNLVSTTTTTSEPEALVLDYSTQLCEKKTHGSKVYRLEWVNEEQNVFCSVGYGGKVLMHKILDPMIVWKKDMKERVWFLLNDEDNNFLLEEKGHIFTFNLPFDQRIGVLKLFCMFL